MRPPVAEVVVYLVWHYDYEQSSVVCAFLSKAEAEAHIATDRLSDCGVVETTLYVSVAGVGRSE